MGVLASERANVTLFFPPGETRDWRGICDATREAMLFFDWRLFLIVIVIFLIAVALTRYVSLGSVLAAAFFPLGVLLARHGSLSFIISLVAAGFVIFKHRGNNNSINS